MGRSLFIALLFCVNATVGHAQNINRLIGKRYDKLSDVKGFEHYVPVKGYDVFDEMICIHYNDTITYKAIMVFQKDVTKDGKTWHEVADVLKIDETARHQILVIGANKFAAYSESNIIIAIEDIGEDGVYEIPPRSIRIHSAYTLEHKGRKFVSVPLKSLYRIGNDFLMMRQRM